MSEAPTRPSGRSCPPVQERSAEIGRPSREGQGPPGRGTPASGSTPATALCQAEEAGRERRGRPGLPLQARPPQTPRGAPHGREEAPLGWSHLAPVGGNHPQVSRNPVPTAHLYQIPHHHVFRVDLDLLTFPDHQGLLWGERDRPGGGAWLLSPPTALPWQKIRSLATARGGLLGVQR